MSDTDIDWVLKIFCFHFFFRFHFFWDFVCFFGDFVFLEISFFFFTYFLILCDSDINWTQTLSDSDIIEILILSDTDIDLVLKFLNSENFWISFFFEISFFLKFFLIWKKIKETNKNLNKRIYCSLSKQWLIHQQLLSYCIATSKIYKKFDFKAKSSKVEKRLFNSGSRLLPNNTFYYQ